MSEPIHRSTQSGNWGSDAEGEIEAYRTYCVSAFGGFGLAVLSLVAFAYPLMWLLPLAGALVSALALRKIAQDPDHLIGRRAATIGLALSLLIGIGAPTRVLTHRWVVLRQTRRYAEEWFSHLAAGNPHFALELKRDVRKRRPLSDDLWRQYRNNPDDAEALRKYVREPAVAALLALGDSATVRHYEVSEYAPVDQGDMVEHLFAVTYEDDGRLTTFFVRILVGRDYEPYRGVIPLRVLRVGGGIKPPSWQESSG